MSAGQILVVGAGRLGLSLAADLDDAGHRVEVRSRGAASPPFLDHRRNVVYRPAREPPDRHPRVLILAVPDDSLAAVAEEWAGRISGLPGATDRGSGSGAPAPPVALHTSGVHSSAALAPLREAGLAVAAWHPLTALSRPRSGAFRGVVFGVEGDPPAVRAARGLAEELGGRAVDVLPGAHGRYHAAAVFASNFLAACLHAAGEELAAATGGEPGADRAGVGEGAGDGTGEGVAALLPLARAALEEVAVRGVRDGATGPVARGDVGTVSRHLESLDPERAELYRRLARELLAVVAPRLPEDRVRALRELLDEGREPVPG